MVSDTMRQVRDLIAAKQFSKSGLAAAAGLHPNTLRDVEFDHWNPTAATLLALERFLDDHRANGDSHTAAETIGSPDNVSETIAEALA